MFGKVRFFLLFSLGIMGGSAAAQTGIYPFGSFDSVGVDTIDRGSLNVHIEIPVVSKQGRGVPFQYTLVYDGLVWSPKSSTGVNTWTPAVGFGLHGQLNEGFEGYLSYSSDTIKCYQSGGGFIWTPVLSNYAYHDAFGVSHPLPYTVNYCTEAETGVDVPSSDGSGYSTNGSTVYSVDGKQISVPANNQTSSGSITDANGNHIDNKGNGTFTDTLGKTVLTITGSGTASSPRIFEYSTPTGLAEVSITYKTYTVQTNFGCAATEYNLSQDLADTINFSDGSVYQFNYETTPGNASAVTGRLASLKLPQGGTITYQYTGANHGIVCADGTPAGLTRTGGVNRTYARSSITSTSSQTTITDGLNNTSIYNFVIAGSPEAFYETNRSVYQGSATGTPLLSRETCYNKTANPCTTTAITAQITQVDTFNRLNGGGPAGATTTYNAYGLATGQTIYGFGPNATTRGAVWRQETWTYPTTGIVNLLQKDSVADGSNNQIGLTNYSYDETTGTGHAALVATSGLPQHNAVTGQRGNLTTTQSVYNSSGAILQTEQAYEDTGNPVKVTTPNGASTYVYDSATHTFTYTATPPTPSSGVSLSSSATNDANSGVPLTTVDPNSKTTIYVSYDPLLRPTEIKYPDGGEMTASYTPTGMGMYQYMDGSTHTNTEQALNSYGQLNWVAVENGSGGYYFNNYCYDANGNLSYASYRFAAPNQNTISCSGAGDSYTYDALGRVLKITHGDGSKITYTYNLRATQVTDENGASRVIQTDVLGRPTNVCEVSNSTLQGVAPAACGLDIAATGFLTSYTYTTDTGAGNALKTTVTQGAQARSFESDWLGRTTKVIEPESGATTYSYAYSTGAGLGLTITRTKPAANQSNPAKTTTTTTQYDAVGRVVSVTYSDGTPAKDFLYDEPAPSGWTEASQQTNVKGRLSEHYRATAAGGAGSIYGYDAMGRVTLQYSCLPSSCGTETNDRKVAYTYNGAGMLTSESDGANDTYTYSRSIAGEITGLTNSFSDSTDPANLIVPNSVENGPFGPTLYKLGNGLTAINTYDTLGRNSGGWVCAGSSQPTCTGGTLQAYGYTAQRTGTHVTQTCDTSLGVCNSFGYDEFNRLTARTVNQGTVQNFTYTYDRYGNRWAQNAPQGGPALGISFNPSNNIIDTSGYANDALGNISDDSLHTYQYDADGNLTSVDGGETATYYYDSLNQRVRIAPTRGTYEFVFDTFGRRVSTWAASNHGFVEANAYSDAGPLAIRSGGETQFEHQNWLGTERARTSYNGALLLSIASLPWGDGHTPSGDNGDQHDFAQMDRDLEDNSEHAQFRQYSTNLGRWQSPDPYLGSYDFTNPQSMNRYTYALNDPVNLLDPSGLDSSYCDPDEGDADSGVFSNCVVNGDGPGTGACDSDPILCYLPGPGGPEGYFGYEGPGVVGAPPLGPPQLVTLSEAPNNQILPCLVKGAVVGAVGAVAVGALAVGAVAVGAPVAAVTGVLGVLAVAGGAALGYDTIGQIRSGNWAGVAYNAGSVLGGAAVGGGGGRAIAEGINGVASPAWSWASDVAQRFNPSLGSVGQWLGTGPNPGSAGGSAAAAGAGAARAVKKGC